MTSHAGQVALVTGAAQGIGFAIAAQLAAAGAAVGVLDRDGGAAETAAASLGDRAIGVAADVADRSQVLAAAAAVAGAFGPIGLLVCNAGISPKHQGQPAAVEALDPDEWHRVVAVNLDGALWPIQAVVPGMKAAGAGRIVLMSSVAAKTHFPSVAVHYATTKAALIGMTKHLAGELGPAGITVNALAPGRIATPLIRSVAPEINAAAVAATPLRRLGEPEDVASAALWLTGPEAGFITGQVVDVAGGWLMT